MSAQVKDLVGSDIWLHRIIKGDTEATEQERGEKDKDFIRPAQDTYHPKERRAKRKMKHD